MSATLADLQHEFLAAMRGGDERRILGRLDAGRRDSPAGGLAIYRSAYAARLREALGNDHPMLGHYLGDDLWLRLCDAYILECPSKVRSLRDFGDSLPAFLRVTAPFAASPELGELAEFERRLLDCFDAADVEAVDWTRLRALPESDWPGLRLRFHPSMQRLPAAWNGVEIWQALKAGDTPPRASRSDGHWLLWRDPERITRFRSLSDEERMALVHFIEGGDLAGLCDRLSLWRPVDQVPSAALEVLARWAGEGLVRAWDAAHPFAPDRPL